MDDTDRRCHIQYVDVYRDQPDFAAEMVEVVAHQGEDGQPDPHVRFDIEPGPSFRDARMNLVIDEGRAEPAISTWPFGNINVIFDDFAARRQARNLP